MSEPEVIVGPWGGEEYDMAEQEFQSAVEELIATNNEEMLGRTIAGVLEFLTIKAILDGPYYVLNEDSTAVTIIASGEDAEAAVKSLPDNFKNWDEVEPVEYLTDTDPGDEADEPTPESE
jgi:hypothetical protein